MGARVLSVLGQAGLVKSGLQPSAREPGRRRGVRREPASFKQPRTLGFIARGSRAARAFLSLCVGLVPGPPRHQDPRALEALA